MNYQKLDNEPQVAAPAVVVEAPKKERFVVKSCGFMSLGSGVMVLGILDMLSGLVGLGACLIILFARTHEDAVDQAIYANANVTATDIEHINEGIHVAWHSLPLLFLLAIIVLYFGYQGIQAGKHNDIVAARRYYIWKLVHFVGTMFSFALLHILFALYSLIIARSHFFHLQTNILPLYHFGEPIAQSKTLSTPPSSPTTSEHSADAIVEISSSTTIAK